MSLRAYVRRVGPEACEYVAPYAKIFYYDNPGAAQVGLVRAAEDGSRGGDVDVLAAASTAALEVESGSFSMMSACLRLEQWKLLKEPLC
jgi:hypothetical protein